MLGEKLNTDELELLNLLKGDKEQQVAFFMRMRQELKRLIALRMDHRMRSRIDESDVIQDTYVRYLNSIEEYLKSPSKPPVTWLRHLARNVLSQQRQLHIEAQSRDVRRELPQAAHVDLKTLATSFSTAGKSLEKEELRQTLLKSLAKMSTLDREILAMVHIEGKSIRQATMELDLNYETARKRYRRALIRLREFMGNSQLKEFYE